MKYVNTRWLDAFNIVDVPVHSDQIVREQRRVWEQQATALHAKVNAGLERITVESKSRQGVTYPSMMFLQGHA